VALGWLARPNVLGLLLTLCNGVPVTSLTIFHYLYLQFHVLLDNKMTNFPPAVSPVMDPDGNPVSTTPATPPPPLPREQSATCHLLWIAPRQGSNSIDDYALLTNDDDGNKDNFTMVSPNQGCPTTPFKATVPTGVVTPCVTTHNSFAAFATSSPTSDWLPEATTTVKTTPHVGAATLVPKDLEDLMATVLASEHQRTMQYDINMAAFKQEFGSASSKMAMLLKNDKVLVEFISCQKMHTTTLVIMEANTTKLLAEVNNHTQLLGELATNKESHRAQMAVHWQRMDKLDSLISAVNERITKLVNQNLTLDTQMTGICSMVEMAANALGNGLTNLRGRIIPDLHDVPASLKSKVLDLQDLLVSLQSDVSSLKDQITSNIRAKPASNPPPPVSPPTPVNPGAVPPASDSPPSPQPTNDDAPPAPVQNQWGPATNFAFAEMMGTSLHAVWNEDGPGININPDHCSDPFWYHGNNNNPSGDRPRNSCDNSDFNNSYRDQPNRTSSFRHGTTVRNPYPPCTVNTRMDSDSSPLRGGCITSSWAADKERQAWTLQISRHNIAGLATLA
jgi:hypothetical protein